MKKYIQILISLMLILSIWGITSNTFAQSDSGDAAWEWGWWKGIKTYTTEPVPWASCTCVAKDENGEVTHDIRKINCGSITKRLYECSIPEGSSGFQEIFKTMVRWIAIVATLLGVLALVALGIVWAMTGGTDSTAKKFLKEWIQNIIIGLLILYTFGFILKLLAPWVYT